MNCPNCNRPVSASANICPRCKTKLYHNDNAGDGEGSQQKQEITYDRESKKMSPVLKDILLILLFLVLLFVLAYILRKPVIEFTSDISWLKWFGDILTKLSEVLPF